jgi:hypothetical protein
MNHIISTLIFVYNGDTHRSASFQSEGCNHRSPVKEIKEINIKWNANLVDSLVSCFLEFLFEWDFVLT